MQAVTGGQENFQASCTAFVISLNCIVKPPKVGEDFFLRTQMRLEKPPSMRPFACRNLFQCAGHDHFAARVAAFEADVNEMVGGIDDVELAFNQQRR